MWKGEVLKTFLLRHRFDIVSIATVGDVACAALQSPFFFARARCLSACLRS